jgi:hypothetical protein
MPDTKFDYSVAPRRYQDLVQRYAVLYSLRKVRPQTDTMFELTDKVLKMWRARIGALTSLGWLPNNTPHGIMYARNCRPTFVIASPPTRPCTLARICPFCYARRVRDLWVDIDAQFPMGQRASAEDIVDERTILIDDEPVLANDFRYHLVERHHSFHEPVIVDGVDTPEAIVRRLAWCMNQITQSRARIVERINPLGALMFTTIEHSARHDSWKIHNRQIFKVPFNQEIPQVYTTKRCVRCTRITEPTRKRVLFTMARTLRYPAAMIRGDAERTLQILQAMQSVRFNTFYRYRSFRNKRSEQVSQT